MLLATGSPSAPTASEAGGVPAGLVYCSDAEPGISRIRRGDKFFYRDPRGRAIRDERALGRIRKLAIPPAYTRVWICPSPDGHLQATGYDARGRKQYRYHPTWRLERDSGKFDRLLQFSQALPALRRQVRRQLQEKEHSREVVLATVVQLLDTTLIRVGNDQYARENGSFGLTTLRRRHVHLQRDSLRLSFRGKSGVRHDIRVSDARVLRVVRRCLHLPGQELFRYQDADGQVHVIGSSDVNDYLASLCGERFTAKDFRTWHGTVLALESLRRCCGSGDGFTLKQLLAEVSASLGNTPAVCRKAYIHPQVLTLATELAQLGADAVFDEHVPASRSHARGLSAAEARAASFLEPSS